MEMRYTRTRILDECRERYWTVTGVAQRMGYDSSYLYAATNQTRSITPPFVAAACAVFQCDEALLFSHPVKVDERYWKPFQSRYRQDAINSRGARLARKERKRAQALAGVA